MMPPIRVCRSKKQQSKTRKVNEEAEVDRISNLPHDLLVRIVSLLPSTKLAAKTCVLSKNWRYIWNSVSILDFDYHLDKHRTNNNGSVEKLVAFMNRCIILNISPRIDKFRVHLTYKKDFASDVDVWLSYVTAMNVEELVINFSPVGIYLPRDDDTDIDDKEEDDDYVPDGEMEYYTGRYHLPMNTFSNNSTLKILKLRNCGINQASRPISWILLKHLCLSNVTFHDDFISQVLLGCPLLETLDLRAISNFTFLDINSARLRRLVICESDVAPGASCTVKISASNLQTLFIVGFLPEYSLIDLRSLVEAKLIFNKQRMSPVFRNHAMHTKILVKHLTNLRSIKNLTVGRWCLKVLSLLKEEDLPCTLNNILCLRVNTNLDERELPGITRLLGYTPLIETLIVNMNSSHFSTICPEKETLKSHDFDRENYWSSQKCSFALALHHVKTVEIVGFQATKREVELVLFFLKNASKLEKLGIHPQKSANISLEKSMHVTQTILSYPRCSPDAMVVLC